MNIAEARTVLVSQLALYRGKRYAELAVLVDKEPTTHEVVGPSGVNYQIEIIGVWDSGEPGDVRILGHIDDGGSRAYFPLSDDFIMTPSGVFVGEA